MGMYTQKLRKTLFPHIYYQTNYWVLSFSTWLLSVTFDVFLPGIMDGLYKNKIVLSLHYPPHSTYRSCPNLIYYAALLFFFFSWNCFRLKHSIIDMPLSFCKDWAGWQSKKEGPNDQSLLFCWILLPTLCWTRKVTCIPSIPFTGRWSTSKHMFEAKQPERKEKGKRKGKEEKQSWLQKPSERFPGDDLVGALRIPSQKIWARTGAAQAPKREQNWIHTRGKAGSFSGVRERRPADNLKASSLF